MFGDDGSRGSCAGGGGGGMEGLRRESAWVGMRWSRELILVRSGGCLHSLRAGFACEQEDTPKQIGLEGLS